MSKFLGGHYIREPKLLPDPYPDRPGRSRRGPAAWQDPNNAQQNMIAESLPPEPLLHQETPDLPSSSNAGMETVDDVPQPPPEATRRCQEALRRGPRTGVA